MFAKFHRWCMIALILTVFLASCTSQNQLENQVLEIIRKNPVALIESVDSYQEEQLAIAQEKREAQLAIALQSYANDPAGQIGNSPVRGSEGHSVILYEFSDFQCPFCARSQSVIENFLDSHPEVTLVFKHFPLNQIHPEAESAAKAAWAAQQQGKFWEYHDELFANQEKLGEEYYLKLANDLRLNIRQFNQDRSKAITEIQPDIKLGQQIGFGGTPFFTLNGIPLPGSLPLEKFETALVMAQSPSK